MRRTFVAAALALLAGTACSNTATTLRRELGPTPQQQINALQADLEQCEARRAELEYQLQEYQRAHTPTEITPAPR